MERSMLSNPAMVQFFNAYCFAASAYRYGSKMSPNDFHAFFNEPQYHVIDPTNLGGAFYDSVQHRLHVRRRAADDTQDLGRRRLMFQRFAQLRIPLLNFFEQSHVLDGDHRLVGESFEKRDLLVGKGLELHATDHDRSNWDTLAHQRCREHRPLPETSLQHFSERKLRFRRRGKVVNVNRLRIDDRPARDRFATKRQTF